MSQVEKLRDLLRREFGIKDDAGLLAAMENLPELDLGIFCAPLVHENGTVYGYSDEDGAARLRAG